LINEGLANELGNQKAVLVARSSAGDEQLLSKYAAEQATDVDVILQLRREACRLRGEPREQPRLLRLTSKPISSRSGQRRASTALAAM
jgi:hypothetical protein